MGPGDGLSDMRAAGHPLFAHELVHNLRALLALDVAAPVELAVAALRLHSLELVIAAATAHELTAIHALGCLVAKAALCAQRARALVAHAVVRTGVDVDQVLRGGRVEAAIDLYQLAAAVEPHGCRTVILLFQGVAHLAEVSQLQPARLEATGARHPVALAGHISQVVHRPAASLVVVQVHEDARALVGAFGVDAFPLARVHELLGKAISILDVVPAAAPQPVPRQVLGTSSAAAATSGQLALPACAAHGVDHPRGAHRVCEGRLSAAYLHNPAKHGGVIHSAAVPSPVSELILAFFDASLRAFPDVLHVVLVQVA